MSTCYIVSSNVIIFESSINVKSWTCPHTFEEMDPEKKISNFCDEQELLPTHFDFYLINSYFFCCFAQFVRKIWFFFKKCAKIFEFNLRAHRESCSWTSQSTSQSLYTCVHRVSQRAWELKAVSAEMTDVNSHDIQRHFTSEIVSKSLAGAEWTWWLEKSSPHHPSLYDHAYCTHAAEKAMIREKLEPPL